MCVCMCLWCGNGREGTVRRKKNQIVNKIRKDWSRVWFRRKLYYGYERQYTTEASGSVQTKLGHERRQRERERESKKSRERKREGDKRANRIYKIQKLGEWKEDLELERFRVGNWLRTEGSHIE